MPNPIVKNVGICLPKKTFEFGASVCFPKNKTQQLNVVILQNQVAARLY